MTDATRVTEDRINALRGYLGDDRLGHPQNVKAPDGGNLRLVIVDLLAERQAMREELERAVGHIGYLAFAEITEHVHNRALAVQKEIKERWHL